MGYDSNWNIVSAGDGANETGYVYDSANQLIRENHPYANKTWVCEYDNVGNGLSYQWEYSMTGGVEWWPSTAQGATTNTLRIAHTANRVGNLYRCIITDASGNTVTSRPAEIKAATYGTWNFAYNADGLRTERTNGTTTYDYIYSGSQLIQMTVGEDVLYFTYDAAGTPMAVDFNGTKYFYATNLQGDIIAILDNAGNAVVEYTYDAWGNILTATDSTLGNLNPLRYRGYVYDTESTLYYLQSRYYDPELGRFINADSYTSTGQKFRAIIYLPAAMVDNGGNISERLSKTLHIKKFERQAERPHGGYSAVAAKNS